MAQVVGARRGQIVSSFREACFASKLYTNHEPRHCEERSDKAIQRLFFALIPRSENQAVSLDCFAALAMTMFKVTAHPLLKLEPPMKIALGLLLAVLIGVLCRLTGLPLPAPPVFVGALLVLSMTIGYLLVDRYIATHPAVHEPLCGGPSGKTVATKGAGAGS